MTAEEITRWFMEHLELLPLEEMLFEWGCRIYGINPCKAMILRPCTAMVHQPREKKA
jgi:hypothetical protein